MRCSDARSSRDRPGDAPIVIVFVANGRAASPPESVPAPTTNSGTRASVGFCDRARDLAAPRLAVGDQHEQLARSARARESRGPSRPAAGPRQCPVRDWCPTWCRLRAGTAAGPGDDRERRTRCSDRWSGGSAAWRCARTPSAPCGRRSSSGNRQASEGTASIAAIDCRATSVTCIDAEPSCSTTMSRPARPITLVTPRGRASATIRQ